MKRIKRTEVTSIILPLVKERIPWMRDDTIKGYELFSDNKYVRIYMNASDVIQANCIDEGCRTENHEVFINVCRTTEKDIRFSFGCKSCKKRKFSNKDEEVETLTDLELAIMLSDILRGRAAFVPNTNMWYFFNGKKWITDRDGSEIRLEISKSLLPRFKDNAKIYRSLQVTYRRDSIVKECKSLLKDNDFISKLDTNPLLVGFENGVYDFGTRTFRDPLAADYVSFSTGCTFITEFDDNCIQYRKEVASFFRDICLGDLEKCHMLMNIVASAFNGTKRKQLFFLFEGSKSYFPAQFADVSKSGKWKIVFHFPTCAFAPTGKWIVFHVFR